MSILPAADKKTKQSPPATLPVIPDSIPAELRELPQWVTWKWLYKAGAKKPWTKPPYCPGNPRRNAKSNDPKTWSNFRDALARYRAGQVAGVGFVPSPDDDFAGVDLDHCIDQAGTIAPWAQEIIQAVPSYTERSPSGTGIRIICRGTLPPGRRKKGNLEVYDREHYLTLTGHHLDGTPTDIRDCAAALADLVKSMGPEPAPKKMSNGHSRSANLPDEKLLAKALKNQKFSQLWAGDKSGYASSSEADLALCGQIAFWVGPDPTRIGQWLKQSGLHREKHERDDYLERTIAKALEGRTEFYTGIPVSKNQKAALESDSPSPDDDEDDRPTITISTAEHSVNDQAVAALATDDAIYQRGGMLVRIIHEAHRGNGGVTSVVPCSP